MRIIANEDIADIITMPHVVDVLRRAYAEMATKQAAYVPLVWLYAPTPHDDDYYRLSGTTGNSAQYQVAALRIKSDVVSWKSGSTEEKYCVAPGTFCGLILLFSTVDGRPLAILQDGIIQHMRVGAAAALGADLLARRDATTVGMLGSGGMARSYLEAIAHVRDITRVTAYSPTKANLAKFCREMSEVLGVEVDGSDSAEAAVRDSDIVVTATDSIKPTLDASWISPGAHVTCVQRRELSKEIYDRATLVAQLGYNSMPADAQNEGVQRVRGGLSAYIAGTPEQQERIPRDNRGPVPAYPTIEDLLVQDWLSRRRDHDVSLFLPVGTQGVQFSAVAGYVLAECEASGVGRTIPTDWFLEDIRN